MGLYFDRCITGTILSFTMLIHLTQNPFLLKPLILLMKELSNKLAVVQGAGPVLAGATGKHGTGTGTGTGTGNWKRSSEDKLILATDYIVAC